MGDPIKDQVIVDRLQSQISIAFTQRSNFIARRAFPVVNVNFEDGKYPYFTEGYFMRDDAQIVAPGGPRPEGEIGLEYKTYSCNEWAFGVPLADRVRDASPEANWEVATTELATTKALLKFERQLASLIFDSASIPWDNSGTPANLWDSYSTSDPLVDIEDAKRTVLSKTGYLPNVAVMGYEVFSKLLNHPDFIDRVKYTSKEPVQAEIIASLMGLRELFVGKVVVETSKKGATTASRSFVWGKHCLLMYIPETPSLMTPSAGYTFMYQDNEIRTLVDRWRKAKTKECAFIADQKVVASSLGYLLTNVIS